VSPSHPEYHEEESSASKKHNFEGKKDEKLKQIIQKSCQDLFTHQMKKPKVGLRSKEVRKLKEPHAATRNVTPLNL